jgi:hypothetical protein
LLQRLNIFKAALGSIENVLGEFIREMTRDLFSHELSVEQEKEVIQQSYMAIANRRLQEERLEEESSHLIAHGDYIQNKVKAAQELKRFITSEDLHSYFRDFYQQEFPGTRILRVDDDVMRFEIELSGAAKGKLREFLQREKLLGHTRLAQPQGGCSVSLSVRQQGKLCASSKPRGYFSISPGHTLYQRVLSPARFAHIPSSSKR